MGPWVFTGFPIDFPSPSSTTTCHNRSKRRRLLGPLGLHQDRRRGVLPSSSLCGAEAWPRGDVRLLGIHRAWDWMVEVPGRKDMAVCQNLVPLVNIKIALKMVLIGIIAGKWMFIPLKMVLIGIDPSPYGKHRFEWLWDVVFWGKRCGSQNSTLEMFAEDLLLSCMGVKKTGRSNSKTRKGLWDHDVFPSAEKINPVQQINSYWARMNDRGIAGSRTRMNFVNETSSVLDISSNTILYLILYPVNLSDLCDEFFMPGRRISKTFSQSDCQKLYLHHNFFLKKKLYV